MNILVIAWRADGQILNASVHQDEKAADNKARAYLEDEDVAHAVKYYATFQPGYSPDTTLTPYSWYEATEEPRP